MLCGRPAFRAEMATTAEQLKAAIEALDLELVKGLIASGAEVNQPLTVIMITVDSSHAFHSGKFHRLV
jgi:hypothetical protein